tara:strand:+ start:3882 stop:5099 length:1218 start_codon:yes stop_codon:yes gene_type:complete
MNNKVLSFISKLKKFNRNYENKKYRLIAYNSVFTSKYLYLTHFSSSKIFFNSPYREIFLNYFVNAEKKYPGSSKLLSSLIVEKFTGENSFINAGVLENKKENLENYFLQDIDKSVVKNFLNILEFSGPNSTLNCNLTKNSDFKVEKFNLPEFYVKIHEEFNNTYFKNQSSSTKNYLTCLYDGFIERESEVFSLIEKSKANNRCPVLLFCRGISDYAVSIIKQMMLKNRIYLYPYICKFSNDDPFLFEDLSKIFNLNSYNIESGDNLHKSLSENSDFRKVKLYSNKIEIYNPNKTLQEEITDQISKVNNEEAKEYLYKRKNRCAPNNVFISIPYDKVKDLNTYKSMIRCYNKIAINGLIKSNDIIYSRTEYQMCKNLVNKLFETIKNIGFTIKKVENKNELYKTLS